MSKTILPSIRQLHDAAMEYAQDYIVAKRTLHMDKNNAHVMVETAINAAVLEQLAAYKAWRKVREDAEALKTAIILTRSACWLLIFAGRIKRAKALHNRAKEFTSVIEYMRDEENYAELAERLETL